MRKKQEKENQVKFFLFFDHYMRSNRSSVRLIVHPTALNANKPELQRSQVQLDYSRGSYPLLHLAKTQHSDFEHFTSRRNFQLSVEIHPGFNGFPLLLSVTGFKYKCHLVAWRDSIEKNFICIYFSTPR